MPLFPDGPWSEDNRVIRLSSCLDHVKIICHHTNVVYFSGVIPKESNVRKKRIERRDGNIILVKRPVGNYDVAALRVAPAYEAGTVNTAPSFR